MESANEFFRMNIHQNASIEDVNSEIRDMQNITFNGEKNSFDTNYRAISKNELKRQFKTLENQIQQPEGEVMYFSKLL